MSSEEAVRFDHVTKSYRVRTGQSVILELWRRRGVRRRAALDDVSFSITHGERVALIGDNGAGKTTALRLISRITRPSSGSVAVNGKVGALLEVGSGMNLDMTGRENIWLYGNILGLTRRQVAERFDVIVGFSELGDVLDQQVKYYSSGMQLRLGFSIAAHLDPDILIVDEALAVGDVSFQRKCLELMSALPARRTTLLYVSHDLRTVEALCDRVIWIDGGRVRADGPMHDVVGLYLDSTRDHGAQWAVTSEFSEVLRLVEVSLFDADGQPSETVESGRGMSLRLVFDGSEIERPHVAIGLSVGGASPFAVCSMAEHGTAPSRVSGRWACTVFIDRLPLRRGTVEIWMGVLASDALQDLVSYSRIGVVTVEGPVGSGPRGLTEIGPVVVDHRFEIEQLD